MHSTFYFLCDIDNVSIFPLTYNTTLIKFIINYHLFNSLYTFTITFTRYNLHVVQWMTMLQLLCIFFIKIGKDFLLFKPEIRASLSFVIKKTPTFDCDKDIGTPFHIHYTVDKPILTSIFVFLSLY